MNKFLIVDGSNLLFQMFFGMPARIVNGVGKPIQGTLGFVGAFLRMVRMTRPTHAAVIFDGEHGTERNEISSDYKANRRDFTGLPDADSPFSQLDDICAALDLLGVFRTEAEVYEADDVIASYATRLGGSGEYRVVVASQDSDLYQLIGENVSVLRYRGKKSTLCDAGYVRERFGVAPERYADLKSLTGDASDNIRGVRGVGPKTAAALIARFGSIEELLAHTDLITRPALRSAIEENTDRIRKNYRLIKLTDRAGLPAAPARIAFDPDSVTTADVLRTIGLT